MEAVIGLAIIITLLYVLGVNPYYIMEGVMILLILVLAATLLFFIATAISLIGSKRIKAVFDRIDKPEGKTFPSAVYISEGQELRNAFPNEFVLKKILYKKDREVTLRVTRGGKIYDKYSVITIVAGLLLGSASIAFLSNTVLGVLL